MRRPARRRSKGHHRRKKYRKEKLTISKEKRRKRRPRRMKAAEGTRMLSPGLRRAKKPAERRERPLMITRRGQSAESGSSKTSKKRRSRNTPRRTEYVATKK